MYPAHLKMIRTKFGNHFQVSAPRAVNKLIKSLLVGLGLIRRGLLRAVNRYSAVNGGVNSLTVTKKGYFEGWYFKQTCNGRTVAFIPGVQRDNTGWRYAFIQVITNETSHIIRYPYRCFYADPKRLCIRIGQNVFSEKYMALHIQRPGFYCRGKIRFGACTPVKYDIMGPFALLPGMECRHGIISMWHTTAGNLSINGEKLSFDKGKGYIEKDWGHSFPQTYTWVQCNDFKEKAGVFAAVAQIPVGRFSFQGVIAAVYWRGKEYRFATYNGGKVLYCQGGLIVLQRGKYVLQIAAEKGKAHPLAAPKKGKMCRTVRERLSCPAQFILYRGKQKVFELHSQAASFECGG